MKRKWKDEMRVIKQESSKEILCTHYFKKPKKKIEWTLAEKRDTFSTVNLLGSFLEKFILEPTKPNQYWNGMIRILVDIIWWAVLL